MTIVNGKFYNILVKGKLGVDRMNVRMLKGIRVSKGYTQKPVADAAQMNVATYCDKENGKRSFSPSEIEKIATFLGMDIYQVNEVFFDQKLVNGKQVQSTYPQTGTEQ